MPRNPQVGEMAPDFQLKDQHGQAVALSGLRGRRVVLSFHPLAWTSVCTQQMQDLEAHHADLAALGAVAVGVSVDSVPCKKAWAEAIGVRQTALLADFWPHGGVARAYGLFREQDGFSERAVLILDGAGIVVWRKVYPLGERPDIQEVLRAVREA